MTKFMRMVEQNLPGSDFRDHLDLIMEFKTAVNALNSSKKCNFRIIPVEGQGNEGTVELKHDDGRSCLLVLKVNEKDNEEAEDPVTKNPNPLTDMLNKADPRLSDKAKRAALVVGSELERIAANRPK